MINKWLTAGVLDGGVLQRPAMGTPQGGVISPLLSNIFRHDVLDKGIEETVRVRTGPGLLVRYDDDLVMASRDSCDCERVLASRGKRLAKYGLRLHPSKTRVVDSRPCDGEEHGQQDHRFDCLGFTHVWGKSRRGRWVVQQFTMKSRLARSRKAVWEWCRLGRHTSLLDQQRYLSRVIRGHCNDYRLTGNGKQLGRFRRAVMEAWRKWLGRHTRKGFIPWARFNQILARYPLPAAKVVRAIYAA